MPSIVYTNQRSKLSKKQRAQREALLKEQRAAKKSLEQMLKQSRDMGVGFIDPVPYCRSTERGTSVGTGVGNAPKRESPIYTGDQMIGIGQMHKSNAVPIFKQEDAEDLARMRR